MQIDIRRMLEYNGYNFAVLDSLWRNGHLSEAQYKSGLQAMNTLADIYKTVKGGKSADGNFEIVNAVAEHHVPESED